MTSVRKRKRRNAKADWRGLLLCLLTLGTTVEAEGVRSWGFDGQANDGLSAVGGRARFATAEELPGVQRRAVALGVSEGDAQYLEGAAPGIGPSYTIEAWIHPTDVSERWQRLVLCWGRQKRYHFAIHNGTVSLYHAQADGGECFAEGGRVVAHRWHHIVGVARADQKRIEVYLNGKLATSTAFDGTLRDVNNEKLGIGDSAGTPHVRNRYRGYIDSITIWDQALSPAVIADRAAARQVAIDLPSREDLQIRQSLEELPPLGKAIRLEELARAGKLSDELAAMAGNMLDHEDLFVRAMAEWAIARRIGRDNNHEEAKWTASGDAPWFRKWLAIPLSDRIEMDWCRQAVSLGIHDDTVKLKASIDEKIARNGARELGEVRKKMDGSTDTGRLRKLWLEARRINRPLVFAKARLGFDEIILYNRYALHYKPNVCGVHTSWSYKPGGDIVIVSGLGSPRGERSLIEGQLGPGHVHGFDLWFDGDKVVFAWASQPEWPPRYSTRWPRRGNDCFAFELRNTTTPPHLYEMNIARRSVTQLTDHNFWTDVEPVYCPDGTIAFTSDRSAHSPSCDGTMNDLTDHNLYSLSADRKRIRRLTNQKDVDMHPHLLDNGLIAYLRWEYQERHFWDVHSVWTVRPDGTMSDALFKQHLGAPLSVRDARSIPGTNKLVAIAAGHHALPKGPVVILDPSAGVNAQRGIETLTVGSRPQETSRFKWKRTWDKQVVEDGGVQVNGGFFMMPYAASEKAFLVSYAYGNRAARRYRNQHADVDSNGLGIYLIDSSGSMELVYRSPLFSCYGAIPYQRRVKPAVLPDAVDITKNYATCSIPDIYEGMDGVERGTVKYIRIAEALPWPIVPGEGVKRWDKSNRWCPVRVIGTVPVEDDGSAHFRVPVADHASVYFQALDENHMEIRRMRSSVSFQPGERRSCNGCHETAGISPSSRQGTAAARAADMPVPPEWGANRQLAFGWMIQPILDRHCVSCHGTDAPKKGLDLTEGKAYGAIHRAKLLSLSPMRGDGSVTKPYQYGSHKSRLITQLLRADTPCNAGLSEHEWIRLVTWVDANAPNRDGMRSKRTADGRNWIWEPYEWKDPWAPPAGISAKGEYVKMPRNKWLTELEDK